MIYTSGTTGPSKGVMSSYLQRYSMRQHAFYSAGSDDRYLVNLPLFHVGGTGAVYAHAGQGRRRSPWSNPSTPQLLAMSRAARQSTCLILLGVMAPFLLKAPPGAAATATIRCSSAVMVPLSEDVGRVRANASAVDVYTDLQHDRDRRRRSSRSANPQRRRHLRPAARRRRGPHRRRERLRGGARRGRRADRAQRPPVGDEPRLLQQSRRRRRGPGATAGSTPATPSARRGRQVLLRRPAEGRDPPARREHLLVRGRDRGLRPSRGARGGGGRRAERVRRGRGAGRGGARSPAPRSIRPS